MKYFSLFLVIVIFVYISYGDDRYTTRFDNIDVDEILQSERLLNNYVACLKGTGRCTAEGAELKKVLPDALETECQKCSEKQKDAAKRVMLWLIKNKPQVWKDLMAIYDPERKFRTRYEELAKEGGVDLKQFDD